MSSLHYTDPAARGPNDVVHKSFFYGSKHIDQYVPLQDPNPRSSLTNLKTAQWSVDRPPMLAAAPIYMSESLGASLTALSGIVPYADRYPGMSGPHPGGIRDPARRISPHALLGPYKG